MSLMSATLYERNLIKIIINFGSRFGPASRHCFRDGLQTIRNSVVDFSGRIMG